MSIDGPAERLLPLNSLADALVWACHEREVAAELDVTVDVVRVRLDNLTCEEKDWIEARIMAKEESA